MNAGTPVIVTILLVAISVVGGSILFVFAQDFAFYNRISTDVQPEFITMLGYDAKDEKYLLSHDGKQIFFNDCCHVNQTKTEDRKIAIYIQNHSVLPITISELKLAGEIYEYSSTVELGSWRDDTDLHPREYIIMTGNIQGDSIQENSPRILPGEIATIVFDFDKPIKNGRDMQVKLATSNGNVFSFTMIAGQNII